MSELAERYPELNLRLATKSLAKRIAANMRREDRDECLAEGVQPLDDILDGMICDVETYVVLWNDTPMFVWGWRPMGGGRFLWGLSTTECDRHPRAVYETGKAIVSLLLEEGCRWYGFVDERYVRSRRWLERIGFKVGEPFTTDNGTTLRKITLGR